MSNNKNKKKQHQPGGLQPKGGAAAIKDAQFAAAGLGTSMTTGSVDLSDPKEAKKAAKDARKVEILKAKEKAKKDKADKKDKKSGGLVKALKETGGELKKVRWPSLRTTFKQTGVVLGVVVIFSIFVFGIDRVLSALYELLTRGL